MKHRKLGNDLQVSAIGYGCMGLSGVYGTANDDESVALLRHVVDLGVNLIDTADVYGNGHNETVVGRALRGIRDRVILATKFGQRRTPEGVTTCSTPEYVHQACTASLQRLQTDHIDLYLQHRLDRTVPIEDTVGAMAELVKQGKVRYIGLSECSVATLLRAHAVHPIAAVESELSLWTRADQFDIVPACRELGVGYMAYSPLGRGFLTGTVTGRGGLEPQDTRQRHPRFAPENIAENLKIAEALKIFASRKGWTPAQLAIAWVLAQGEHVVPIPGTRSAARVAENIAAVELHLSADDLKALDAIAPPGVTKGDRYPAAMMPALDR